MWLLLVVRNVMVLFQEMEWNMLPQLRNIFLLMEKQKDIWKTFKIGMKKMSKETCPLNAKMS